MHMDISVRILDSLFLIIFYFSIFFNDTEHFLNTNLLVHSNAYSLGNNLYIIKNTVAIVPRENFTKETNNF